MLYLTQGGDEMLILSSCDFRNENSKKVILENLPKPIEQCKVLFFPNEKATRETIHSEKFHLRLQEFGFNKANIHIFDYYSPKDFYNLDLDVIYISGGNTFMTLQRIRDCGFDKQIISYVKRGVTYIGGSAGAHIATKDITHVKEFDLLPEDMIDFKGLGLFDGILICHYTEERKEILDKLQNSSKYKVFSLTNDESIII